MAVLAFGQIADPDAVTHFPQFFRVRLSKFFLVLFMDGRQLLLNLLTLTPETQEKIKGVFAPVFLHNGRHAPESNWIPPEQETVGRVRRYGTRKVIETPQCHRQFPVPLTGGCVGLLQVYPKGFNDAFYRPFGPPIGLVIVDHGLVGGDASQIAKSGHKLVIEVFGVIPQDFIGNACKKHALLQKKLSNLRVSRPLRVVGMAIT